MEFPFSDEQILLKDSINKLLTASYSFERRREIVASEDGYSRDIWRAFAEMGLLSLPFDEAHGGAGGSAIDLYIVMEAFGRHIVVEPFLATIVLAGGLLRYGGTQVQKSTYIPPIISGEKLYAVALSEIGSRYNLANVAVRAVPDADSFVISGQKSVVYGAPMANGIFVTARTSGERIDPDGISLFLIDANAPGLSRRDYVTIDGMRASELTFEKVRVTADRLIGKEGEAFPVVEQAVDEALAATAAEAVGMIEALNAQVIEHCRTRIAFGRPLSAFQVLQHRMVDMRVSYEHCAAMAMRAAEAMQHDRTRRAAAASAAAVQIGRDGDFVGVAAIQCHGAMGMTDELSIGHYYKRLVAIGSLFGDIDHHLTRFVAHSELAPRKNGRSS